MGTRPALRSIGPGGAAARAGLLVVAVWLVLATTTAGAAAETLPVLARVGPWPVVSRLIGYQGRLWLANSVKGVNHNSADLYSYRLADGELRYERQLFSQDAGSPAVAGGLLYWPFEDARFSTGVGHFMVTDGERWRFGVIPTAPSFHTHAMASAGGRLVAATSAWRAGLQVSDDGGRSWRQVYDQPTPAGQVTRIVTMEALGDLVFGPLVGRDQQRLLMLDGTAVAEVPGWPKERAVHGLATFGRHLYGAVVEAEGVAIWRTDGSASERVAAPRRPWPVRDLAADARGLWALTAGDDGGAIWHSPDGRAWTRALTLAGGRPHDLATFAGALYVGGAGADGQGILWGGRIDALASPTIAAASAALSRPAPNGPAPIGPASAPPAAALEPWLTDRVAVDWAAAGRRLDRLLADPGSYASGGPLQAAIYQLALADPPADFLTARFWAPMPAVEVARIGGHVRMQAATLGRWLLAWGIALAGEGRVPPALIEAPWATAANRPEKYFETAPAALFAVATVGQDDAPTIDALVARLARSDDPLWLRGDVVGALSAVTGQRFGYDAQAWQAWWARQRPSWPR